MFYLSQNESYTFWKVHTMIRILWKIIDSFKDIWCLSTLCSVCNIYQYILKWCLLPSWEQCVFSRSVGISNWGFYCVYLRGFLFLVLISHTRWYCLLHNWTMWKLSFVYIYLHFNALLDIVYLCRKELCVLK